jgi:peptidyl-prolyl cis-trans isomerase SurA
MIHFLHIHRYSFLSHSLVLLMCASIPQLVWAKAATHVAPGATAAATQQKVTLSLDRPLRIAAVVNDDVITTQDVEERALLVMALSGGGASDEERARIIASTLSRLIDETLQAQESKRQSVITSDEEIDRAIAGLEKARGRPVGSLAQFIQQTGLSMDSLRSQFAVQIAWNKAIARKIRRSLTVTDAEVTRAQQAALSPHPITQVFLSAISIPIATPKDDAAAAARANALGKRLASGESFDTLARSLIGAKDVVLVPALWVDDTTLEPALARAISSLAKDDYSKPIRSQQTYQIVHLIDRRQVVPVTPDTEIALKQITLSLKSTFPAREHDLALDTLIRAAQQVQTHPGSCATDTVETDLDANLLTLAVHHVRTTFGQLNQEMRGLMMPLKVGEVSEPYALGNTVEMLMLCEKIDAPLPLPDAEKIKEKIIAERADLEAERVLRNLKRDAFIEIKSGTSSTGHGNAE